MKQHLVVMCSALLAAARLLAQPPSTGPFDLVIANGRVMDPESNTDAVRAVGITGGVIRAVSEGRCCRAA